MKWIAFCFVLTGCGPSCEEQGGTSVQQGYYYVMQTIGTVNYMQAYPNFVCVVKEKNS